MTRKNTLAVRILFVVKKIHLNLNTKATSSHYLRKVSPATIGEFNVYVPKDKKAIMFV
ncbi:hypothetical protein KAS42_01160 [bacterium]|nr:hypothetical protein [bacterium]